MITIENQIADHNGIINNAEQINHLLFDDPLRFFCEAKVREHPAIKAQVQVMEYILNKDQLKKRFSGSDYKYRELLDYLEEAITKQTNTNPRLLDDGYKSVIQCIGKFVSYFTMDDGGHRLRTYSGLLYAEVTSAGLRLKYGVQVNAYDVFLKAREQAEELRQSLAPYLSCATQYGNFFEFNHIFIDPLTDAPFFTEEVKFRVSNDIIPNLIKPLYGDSPECGLREIIQNASDATKEYLDQSHENGSAFTVDIHIYDENGVRKLRVRDYGIGMTKDILLNHYFVIGKSSKNNSGLNLVGQFGIGALAAFLLGNQIEVRTKPWNEQHVFHFKYYLNEEQHSNINVNIEMDDQFLHGTEVTITLHQDLGKLNSESLIEKLKLNEWYVLPDTPIQFQLNGRPIPVTTFTGEGYSWTTFYTAGSLTASYLNRFGKDKPHVILNGLMVPEPYPVTCNYLKFTPHISIQSYYNEVRLNLERSRIESGLTKIVDSLKTQLIHCGLEQFQEDGETIVDKELLIKQFHYENSYIWSIPLFFCRDGFGICSSSTMKGLSYRAIVQVYGYRGFSSLKLSDLEEGLLYIFDFELNKSDLSKLIECNGSTYVPTNLIRAYFYDATSHYDGFRLSTMNRLYDVFHKEKPQCSSANDFWQIHNQQKAALFQNYFPPSEHVIVGTDFNHLNSHIKALFSSCIVNIMPKNAQSIDRAGAFITDDIGFQFIEKKR